MSSHLYTRVVVLMVAMAFIAKPAFADLTAFLGSNRSPSNRTAVTGASLGISLLIVGFEFEYSNTREDQAANTPSLKTGMFNVVVQTPFGNLSGLQFYGTLGGGMYREQLDVREESSFGSNVGGGVKISLAGPLRLRFDYRLFSLRGNALHRRPQRLYAGLNLAF